MSVGDSILFAAAVAFFGFFLAGFWRGLSNRATRDGAPGEEIPALWTWRHLDPPAHH